MRDIELLRGKRAHTPEDLEDILHSYDNINETLKKTLVMVLFIL